MSKIDPRLSVPCGEGDHHYCRTDSCPCRCHAAPEPTPAEFVERYIAGMPWTDDTPDDVRELVRQNVRMFAYCLSRTTAPRKRVAEWRRELSAAAAEDRARHACQHLRERLDAIRAEYLPPNATSSLLQHARYYMSHDEDCEPLGPLGCTCLMLVARDALDAVDAALASDPET